MLQRFVERYQLWRQEKLADREGTNPLKVLVEVAVFILALDIFTLVGTQILLTSKILPWRSMIEVVLLAAFLIFHLRRSPLAWWFIPAWGVFGLVEIAFILASPDARFGVGIWFSLAFVFAVMIYAFVTRRRYLAYLEGERGRAIDANI